MTASSLADESRRPTRRWLLLAVAIALLLGYALGAYLVADRPSGRWGATRRPALVEPNARLTPEGVVKLQLEGLARERGDLSGIKQCFNLASPLNRQATGPLERFAAMVAAEP